MMHDNGANDIVNGQNSAPPRMMIIPIIYRETQPFQVVGLGIFEPSTVLF